MSNYIGIDTASEVSTACVMQKSGKLIQETKLITSAKSLISFVKSVPRPRVAIIEEGCQASWFYTLFEPICNDVIVCDPVQNADLLKKSKGDVIDARRLADWGRAGLLHRVWHGGRYVQELREALRHYQALTTQSTKLKNQIKAVFRSRGVRVGSKAYSSESREEVIGKLPYPIQRERVKTLGNLLDVVTEERAEALALLIKHAEKSTMYKPVKSIDGFGPILTAMFIAEVGSPHRFRSRKQFWTYCGLGVVTRATCEYYVDRKGGIRRDQKKTTTRGLVRQYNRTLKYVMKQAALVASRTRLKEQYKKIRSGTKNDANAQLTLARKLAAVALRLAKNGEYYDVTRAFD